MATHQWFPDYTGGSARVATESARALARRGHEVTVLAPGGPSGPSEEWDGRLRVKRVRRNPSALARTPVTEDDPLDGG